MATQLTSPSPLPPPPIPTPTLPAQINAATRKQHTELNRLIVERLPLALPPKASDPRLLGQGLAPFAALFSMFEEIWQEINESVEADEDGLTGTHDAQVRRWLATLIPPELPRSARLRADLEYTSPKWKLSWLTELVILRQMREELRAKPHVLLAYGWVMYMAIFSGGRWIRQQLANAGVEFWTGVDPCMELDKHKLQMLELPGFSFLSFDGDQDGEELKSLFKARLAEAEILLTQQERQDIILAARNLFDGCVLLIGVADILVWWQDNWKKLVLGLLCIVGAIWLLLQYWRGNFG